MAHLLAAVGDGPYALTALDLSWCEELDEAAVCSLVMRCPLLETVGFRRLLLTDRAAEVLATHCPRLRKAQLSRAEHISDAGVAHLCARCPLLESLNIGWCEGLTNAGLFTMMTALQCLSALSIEGCKAVSGTGIQAAVTAHSRFVWGLSSGFSRCAEVHIALECRHIATTNILL